MSNTTQYYRIIETRTETQTEIFETYVHYYEKCESTAEGAFIPSGDDFVRVSAGLYTMGAEWVEGAPPACKPIAPYDHESHSAEAKQWCKERGYTVFA